MKRGLIGLGLAAAVWLSIGASSCNPNPTATNVTEPTAVAPAAGSASTVPGTAATTASTAPTTTLPPGVVAITGYNGESAQVKVSSVIDPAQGANQFMTPDAGKRFVAVDMVITNTASAALSDDADSDTSLIGSDNQTYTADFDSVSGCTNFNHGEFQLNPGESTTGCVVFQVPQGVTVSAVKFGLNGGFSTPGEFKVTG